MNHVMITANGNMLVIEPFGYVWGFEGIPGLGYWADLDKMVKFYVDTFGMVYVGEL